MTSLLFETKSWAEQQFAGCELGDKRRTERLVTLAAQVVSHPPGACRSRRRRGAISRPLTGCLIAQK